MTFVDEVTIHARAGKGGDGVVRWRHEKNREFAGPSGGDGGSGGDVYARAVRDTHLLSRYRTQKKLSAENGEPGKKNSLEGADGEDLDIIVPVGSIITNTKTKEEFRLNIEDERVLILKGGHGGRGNESYKSSIHTRPDKATPGKIGEEATLHIEMELIAHAGLIGLPSAGKTSLLNALTNADGKVGAYHFTTIEPNLGELFGYILADIPGLIEGASDGRGLGHRFLKHIKRTELLIHLISLKTEDVLLDYRTIRKELMLFDKSLDTKQELIVLSKTDTVSEKEIADATRMLEGTGSQIATVSILDPESLKQLTDLITHTLSKNTVVEKPPTQT